MVCVACKTPNGIVLSGAGKSATIKGAAQVEPQERAGGYALTQNVDSDLWAAWLKNNADSALVQNNIVFAEENLEVLRVRAWSRNRVQGWNGAKP